MSYRIEQDFEYAGKDYWHWRAWIDADAAEMEQVAKVVWILHPSFKRTRVESSKPEHGFRLVASGWGTFRLRAEVVLKAGPVVTLSRNLKLEYPDRGADEGLRGGSNSGDYSTQQAPARGLRTGPDVAAASVTAAESRQRSTGRSVFLSYSGEDSRAASRLRSQLENAGVSVLDASRIESGQSWAEALRQMMARADAVVALVTEREASPFVVDELQAALAAEKPTLALVPLGGMAGSLASGNTDGAPASFGLPAGIQRLEFDPGRSDPAQLLSLIESQAGG